MLRLPKSFYSVSYEWMRKNERIAYYLLNLNSHNNSRYESCHLTKTRAVSRFKNSFENYVN